MFLSNLCDAYKHIILSFLLISYQTASSLLHESLFKKVLSHYCGMCVCVFVFFVPARRLDLIHYDPLYGVLLKQLPLEPRALLRTESRAVSLLQVL